MSETSASIASWGAATFGPAKDLRALVARAGLELAELDEALASGDSAEALREAADVVILLHRVAAELGGDLAHAVDAKMVVNRSRAWSPAGDGTGSHIAGPHDRRQTVDASGKRE
jgi:hypothetical protein